jgi:hypothetical protein
MALQGQSFDHGAGKMLSEVILIVVAVVTIFPNLAANTKPRCFLPDLGSRSREGV